MASLRADDRAARRPTDAVITHEIDRRRLARRGSRRRRHRHRVRRPRSVGFGDRPRAPRALESQLRPTRGGPRERHGRACGGPRRCGAMPSGRARPVRWRCSRGRCRHDRRSSASSCAGLTRSTATRSTRPRSRRAGSSSLRAWQSWPARARAPWPCTKDNARSPVAGARFSATREVPTTSRMWAIRAAIRSSEGTGPSIELLERRVSEHFAVALAEGPRRALPRGRGRACRGRRPLPGHRGRRRIRSQRSPPGSRVPGRILLHWLSLRHEGCTAAEMRPSSPCRAVCGVQAPSSTNPFAAAVRRAYPKARLRPQGCPPAVGIAKRVLQEVQA